MEIQNVRHSWPEAAGFELDRPGGAGEYILLHFQSAVELCFDGACHSAAPGTLIIFRPRTPHRFVSRGPLLHDWMHLTGNVDEELAPYGIHTNTLYSIAAAPQLTERVAQLESEFLARGAHWERMTRAVLDELWISIARELEGHPTQPVLQETAGRLRRLRSEMILHPEYPWTNEMMARQLSISVSRLYPLYRRLFSIPPGQDLILMRVEKAKQLLQQGHTVAQTAEQLGYGSVYHFIRQFNKITGVTPGKWAK